MQHKVKAFSLFEIGLALLIIGIIGAQVVPMIKKTLLLKKHEISKRNQESLVQSIAAYTKRKNRLPFASTPALKGTEQVGLAIGIPPYQTLGLNDRTAKDGFGHYMTYAMNTTLGSATSIISQSNHDQSFCAADNRAIRTLTLTNQTIPTSDYIAVLIVAHYNGEGAYMMNGNRSIFKTVPTDNSRCRAQNITDSGLFCAEASEDTITWVTRNNFLSTYMQTQCFSSDALNNTNNVEDAGPEGLLETE